MPPNDTEPTLVNQEDMKKPLLPSESQGSEKTAEEEAVLTSAPPPWHSVAVMVAVSILFCHNFPSWEQVDQVATLATFSRTDPWIGSAWTLGWIRLAVAAAIWTTSLYLLCGPGWTQVTKWGSKSQLKSGTSIRMKGIKTMTPFTSWSWNLLGLSYTLNGLIALCVATNKEEWIAQLPHNWLLRLALVAWEISAPCAILVSTVIRYAIWEMDLKRKKDTTNLKSFRNMMMHNANSFLVLAEVGLLGGLPVRLSHVSLAPLFGVAYIFFTWFMACRWAAPEHGPQFIYFFMDTTLGKTTSFSLLALLAAQLLFYVLFAYARTMLELMSHAIGAPEDSSYPLAWHVCFVLGLSSVVMRFRD